MHVPAILVNSSPSTWGVFTIGFCLIAVSLFFMLFKSRWSGPEPFKTWEWLGRFIFAGLVILVVGGVFWPLSLLVFAHTPQPNLWKPFSFFLLCLDTCVLLGGGGITLWVLQHTHQTPYDGAENAPSPRRWPWRLGFALLQTAWFMSPTWVPPSFQRIALAVLLPLLASVCLGMEAQHQHPSDLRFHLRLLVPPILGLVLGIAVLLFGLVFSL